MSYSFRLLESSEINWKEIENCPDSTIYKTEVWFNYLKKWKCISPFIVEIIGENNSGFFVGEKIKKVVTIIGSPFEGLGTAHQGLSMKSSCSGEERILIYKDISKWIFDNHYASFLQVEDWQLTMNHVDNAGVVTQGHSGYMIDLSLSEEELYHNLQQKSCRYSINKSIKNGITIRETQDPQKFIDIYYEQLIEVFNKQGLTPTYSKDCVVSLIDSLDSAHLLLLESVTQDGEIAATGIFPGEKNLAIFWGGASYQKFQKLCPNEPLIWEAIKIWKQRGAKVFDLCGVRQYKLKFGPIIYTKPRLLFAKYSVLFKAKNLAKSLYYGLRDFKAKFKK